MKRIIDERQEQEAYRIEHYAFWTIFGLLVLSIPVQLILLQDPLSVAAECALTIIASLFILIASIRKGAWGTYTTPTPKSYILAGLLSAVAGGIVVAVLAWGSVYRWLYISIGAVALFAIGSLSACVLGVIVKRHRERLANDNE